MTGTPDFTTIKRLRVRKLCRFAGFSYEDRGLGFRTGTSRSAMPVRSLLQSESVRHCWKRANQVLHVQNGQNGQPVCSQGASAVCTNRKATSAGAIFRRSPFAAARVHHVGGAHRLPQPDIRKAG
jgi:hypothetical protein